MECPDCGKQLDDTTMFCPGCGWLVEAQEVETVPAETAAERLAIEAITKEGKLSRERGIYLELTLISWGATLALYLIFIFTNPEQEALTIALNFGRVLIFIPAFGAMMYAVIRFGMFMEFNSSEWVVAVLIFLICLPFSLYFMLNRAKNLQRELTRAGPTLWR